MRIISWIMIKLGLWARASPALILRNESEIYRHSGKMSNPYELMRVFDGRLHWAFVEVSIDKKAVEFVPLSPAEREFLEEARRASLEMIGYGGHHNHIIITDIKISNTDTVKGDVWCATIMAAWKVLEISGPEPTLIYDEDHGLMVEWPEGL